MKGFTMKRNVMDVLLTRKNTLDLSWFAPDFDVKVTIVKPLTEKAQGKLMEYLYAPDANSNTFTMEDVSLQELEGFVLYLGAHVFDSESVYIDAAHLWVLLELDKGDEFILDVCVDELIIEVTKR